MPPPTRRGPDPRRAAAAALSLASRTGVRAWDKVDGIVARAAHWIARLPVRVGRLLVGLWEGVRSLRPWSPAWWRSLGRASTWLGVARWLGCRIVDLLEIAAVGEIYETVVDLVKVNTRTLTDEEIRAASSIFGSAVDLRLVRVDRRAVLGPAFSHRDYTSFHTLNGWGEGRRDVLIHELTHVWQYQQAGAIFMPQALHAQHWGAGYRYGGRAGLRAARERQAGLASFNREQQAQIVQDFYRMRRSDPDIAVYASFVQEVSTLTPAQLIAGRPEGGRRPPPGPCPSSLMAMSIEIVFETHALSEDNERGIATGWLPGRLCARGRANAAEMGRRRRDDGIAAVFTSDLRRAAETAEIAFGDTTVPILYDWRLRECDFGVRNGSPAADVALDRLDYCDRPYPRRRKP